MPHRRNLAGSCIGLIGLLFAQQCSAQGLKLVLGYANATEFLPSFVAKDKGLFAMHGLDVTMNAIASSSLVAPALVSGSIDIGINTPPNILLAAEGGMDLVAVSGAARILKTNPRIALVTRAGMNVSRADELKGRKIGVPGLNSSIEMLSGFPPVPGPRGMRRRSRLSVRRSPTRWPTSPGTPMKHGESRPSG
jgi:NitT/TauT family transport system substrate-binding protein